MDWIFDRTETDLINNTSKAYMNASDLNRIEQGMFAIAKSLEITIEEGVGHWWSSSNYSSASTNLIDTTIPTKAETDRIISNLNTIITAAHTQYGYTPSVEVPTSFDKLTIYTLNNLERILSEIGSLGLYTYIYVDLQGRIYQYNNTEYEMGDEAPNLHNYIFTTDGEYSYVFYPAPDDRPDNDDNVGTEFFAEYNDYATRFYYWDDGMGSLIWIRRDDDGGYGTDEDGNLKWYYYEEIYGMPPSYALQSFKIEYIDDIVNSDGITFKKYKVYFKTN